MTVDPLFLCGPGAALLGEAARVTHLDGAIVLRRIVSDLLVRKGVDWTTPILAEYLGLYEGSVGSFAVVWDRRSERFVAHGALFQSADHPQVALVAHIRTAEDCRGFGLATGVVERLLQAGFDRGARVAVLGTDDKLHRINWGEKAANRMYGRLGFAVLAEKRLADTIDWLMAVDAAIFAEVSRLKMEGDGQLPAHATAAVLAAQTALLDTMRRAYAEPAGLVAAPVASGDLAALFLLLNLCPPDDFALKLLAWNVHFGAELEREFVVAIRPAIEDRDRVEDASRVLRDATGRIVAVAAARLEAPFTRQAYAVDFYCLPRLLSAQPALIGEFVATTLAALPRPTCAFFRGVDPAKVALFEELGFVRTGNRTFLLAPSTVTPFEVPEWSKNLA